MIIVGISAIRTVRCKREGEERIVILQSIP